MSDPTELPPLRVLTADLKAAYRRQLEHATRRGTGGRRYAGSAAAIVAVGATAVVTMGAFTLHHYTAKSATDTATVRCYTTADIGDDSTFHGTDVGLAQSNGPAAPATSAIEQCSALWRAGVITAGSRNAQRSTAVNSPVPALVACRLSNGMAGVFPGGPSTCAQLQLPSLVAK